MVHINQLLTRSLFSVSVDCQRRPIAIGKSEYVFCGVASTKDAVAALKVALPGIPPSKERTKDIVLFVLEYIQDKEKGSSKRAGPCQI